MSCLLQWCKMWQCCPYAYRQVDWKSDGFVSSGKNAPQFIQRWSNLIQRTLERGKEYRIKGLIRRPNWSLTNQWQILQSIGNPRYAVCLELLRNGDNRLQGGIEFRAASRPAAEITELFIQLDERHRLAGGADAVQLRVDLLPQIPARNREQQHQQHRATDQDAPDPLTDGQRLAWKLRGRHDEYFDRATLQVSRSGSGLELATKFTSGYQFGSAGWGTAASWSARR